MAQAGNKSEFTTLFVSRKHPPQTGGMEILSYGLIHNYPGDKIAVTYGGKQTYLPLVYPLLFLRAIPHIFKKEVKVIHVGDGVMTPMGWIFKMLTGKPVVFTAHGKDINLSFLLYQLIMPFFFKKMDKVICISRNTLEECLKVGIKKEKCVIIPCGIDFAEFQKISETSQKSKAILENKYNLPEGKKILFTLGRLSKRKGVIWFTQKVMPKLPVKFIYVSVGPDATEISNLKSWLGLKKIQYSDKLKQTISDNELEKRVFWLGRLPRQDVVRFLNCSYAFLMPNIQVKGDVEGFGIVAIEASASGLPVIASNMEGMQDSVIEGKTGLLVESENPKAFVNAIEEIKKRTPDPSEIMKLTQKFFSWQVITQKYHQEFRSLV